jgi:aspartyl-tRNA synthetase
MTAGFDRYFQIARCYRDEDARGDRQPEFTQIDIEMSFVDREDVLSMTEGLMGHVFKKTLGRELPAKFRRLSWEEAQERYGSDKPDLRFDLPLQDFGPFVEAGEFQAFKDALSQGEAARRAAVEKGIRGEGGAVKALVVPAALMPSPYSRKQIEELEAQAKIYRAKGLAWMRVAEGAGPSSAGSAAGSTTGSGGPEKSGALLEGGVSKFFAAQGAAIVSALGAGPGDLILLAADSRRSVANTALGAVRSKLGRDLKLTGPGPDGKIRFEFVWIVDFPMFEFNAEENRWEAAHHMFTWPQEAYHKTLETDPGSVKGDLYDLVLNGFELASGSIRIHDPELQRRIFKIVGFDSAEAERRFGFLTGAFKYGAPPHGGIAPGLDRLVMIMAGETSIKEVIAFPKNSFAQSPMDDSPGEIDQRQLDELHLAVKDQEGGPD